MIVGDLNIRMDRPDDPHCRRVHKLLATYNLSCRVSSLTHDQGGLLDVVLTRNDAPLTPSVDIIDPGLSDHRLLRWTCHLQRPPPVYVSTTYRPWRRLDVETFRQELRWSALCEIVPEDVDSMADLYNT